MIDCYCRLISISLSHKRSSIRNYSFHFRYYGFACKIKDEPWSTMAARLVLVEGSMCHGRRFGAAKFALKAL